MVGLRSLRCGQLGSLEMTGAWQQGYGVAWMCVGSLGQSGEARGEASQLWPVGHALKERLETYVIGVCLP